MFYIQCHFDYAFSFWYPGLSKLLRNRLQVTQDKMIRFILKLDPRSHLGLDEFNSLGWWPVSKRVDQIILNHIFKTKSGTSPDYMKEHFFTAASVHSYSTRLSEHCCFSVPKVDKFGKKLFAYHGCTLWNDLLVGLKNNVGLNNFKTAVKYYFLSGS